MFAAPLAACVARGEPLLCCTKKIDAAQLSRATARGESPLRPALPPSTPPDIAALVRCCLLARAEQRPTARAVVAALEALPQGSRDHSRVADEDAGLAHSSAPPLERALLQDEQEPVYVDAHDLRFEPRPRERPAPHRAARDEKLAPSAQQPPPPRDRGKRLERLFGGSSPSSSFTPLFSLAPATPHLPRPSDHPDEAEPLLLIC